jgi:hypothetical protein
MQVTLMNADQKVTIIDYPWVFSHGNNFYIALLLAATNTHILLYPRFSIDFLGEFDGY